MDLYSAKTTTARDGTPAVNERSDKFVRSGCMSGTENAIHTVISRNSALRGDAELYMKDKQALHTLARSLLEQQEEALRRLYETCPDLFDASKLTPMSESHLKFDMYGLTMASVNIVRKIVQGMRLPKEVKNEYTGNRHMINNLTRNLISWQFRFCHFDRIFSMDTVVAPEHTCVATTVKPNVDPLARSNEKKDNCTTTTVKPNVTGNRRKRTDADVTTSTPEIGQQVIESEGRSGGGTTNGQKKKKRKESSEKVPKQ